MIDQNACVINLNKRFNMLNLKVKWNFKKISFKIDYEVFYSFIIVLEFMARLGTFSEGINLSNIPILLNPLKFIYLTFN